MKKKFMFLIFGLIFILLFAGCAVTLKGPLFRPVIDRPKENSVIYIYWPDENINTQFTIRVNGENIGTLKNTGYIPNIIEPGNVQITAKVQFKYGASGILDVIGNPAQSLEFIAEKGKDYFVRCNGLPPEFFNISMTNGQQLEMLLIKEIDGLNEIKSCKLVD